MKRIFSTVVAMIFAASALSVSAAAAGLKPDATFTVAGKVSAPEIDVTIPTKAGFLINPYKMKVKVHKGDDEEISSDVVAFYGSSIKDNGEEVDENSWKIVNNSTDLPVKGMMYATYRANSKLQVNAESSRVDDSKRQLTLRLEVDGVNVPLLETAPTDWNGSGIIEFELGKNTGSSGTNSKDIILTGSTGDGKQAWTSTDSCTIQMVFKFYPLSN
jgi:hypothetical protein